MSTQASVPKKPKKRMRDDPTWPAFAKLWTGQMVSALGTSVSLVALPLLAIILLDASAAQVGLLATLALAVNPVVLFVGALVDRGDSKRIMVASDLLRALLTIGIVLLATRGMLQMWHLYVLSVLLGILTLYFTVAYQAFMPDALSTSLRGPANAAIHTTNNAAMLVGPALGGWLVRSFGAPLALIADAASFVVSGASIFIIKRQPKPKSKRRLGSIWQDIKQGFRYVRRKRLLWHTLGFLAYSNMFMTGVGALSLVFLVQTVDLDETTAGVLIGAEYAGGLLGGWLVMKFIRGTGQYGIGKLFVAAGIIGPWAMAMVPLTTRGPGILWFVAGMVIPGITASMFLVIGGTYRMHTVQLDEQTHPQLGNLQGRVTATIRTFSYGAMPLGALVATLLASAYDTRKAMWILVACLALSPLWLLGTPALRMTNQQYGFDE